ncbi:DUF1257 domain-containing protein [Planctomyces sp. SH-PL14]|uniref:DUF1257 domain-containing protein n=1 Tax=Planctomyces sp. SH-PL14 TaxID=1632864 RepID=UPI00078CF7E4|nr:DUF1257 domain-containing protein [Planctomyces sp. SH-PL14]AMV16410.1 hypothetical protein VT03_00880 [Planctomyces sp. SH-PL14]
MSHIVHIQTEIRDSIALSAACTRLELSPPVARTVRLFNAEATGLAVDLPGWRYPVVCQLETGQVHYDNFEGRWGDQRHLDRLAQYYAVEKTRIEARRQGYSVTERQLDDGSIRLQVQVSA